jgi:hypothetical protein
LFAAQRERFDQSVQSWPEDIRKHARKLATLALEHAESDDHASAKAGS